MIEAAIGVGVDSLTNQLKNQAVAIGDKQIQTRIPLESSDSQANVYYSTSDLSRSFEGSLTVNALDSAVGIDLGYKDSTKKDAYELFYVLRVTQTVGEDRLQAPYSFTNAKVTNDEFDKQDRGFYRFHAKYGDSFISKIVYGRELNVIIRFSLKSREEQQALKSKLGVTQGKVTVNANFTAALEKALENVDYQIQIRSAGLKIPAYKLLQSFEELTKYLNSLSDADTLTANSAPIRYTSIPYSAISSDTLLLDLINSIAKAKDLYSAILKCKEAVGAALYCFEFEDEVGISHDELRHDNYYDNQKHHKDKLDKLLKMLEKLRV